MDLQELVPYLVVDEEAISMLHVVVSFRLPDRMVYEITEELCVTSLLLEHVQ